MTNIDKGVEQETTQPLVSADELAELALFATAIATAERSGAWPVSDVEGALFSKGADGLSRYGSTGRAICAGLDLMRRAYARGREAGAIDMRERAAEEIAPGHPSDNFHREVEHARVIRALPLHAKDHASGLSQDATKPALCGKKEVFVPGALVRPGEKKLAAGPTGRRCVRVKGHNGDCLPSEFAQEPPPVSELDEIARPRPLPSAVRKGQWWGRKKHNMGGTSLVGYVEVYQLALGDALPVAEVYLGDGEHPDLSPWMLETLARISFSVLRGQGRVSDRDFAAMEVRDGSVHKADAIRAAVVKAIERRGEPGSCYDAADSLAPSDLAVLEAYRALRSLGFA